MKKSLLIIMTVAVLGGLGLYVNNKSPTSVMADSTSSSPASGSSLTEPQSSPTASTSAATSSATYQDGTYNGKTANTLYGNVQVAAVISSGKITDIKFLQMPNDQENSKVVTAMAEPQLKQNAIKAQSAKIDFVSGATQSSEGFKQSLQAALDKAAS